MERTLDTRLTIVWVALVMVTGLALVIAGSHTVAASSVAIAIGFVKARVVAFEFMEVRHSPAWLRRTVDGWCLTTGTVLIAIELAPLLLEGWS